MKSFILYTAFLFFFIPVRFYPVNGNLSVVKYDRVLRELRTDPDYSLFGYIDNEDDSLVKHVISQKYACVNKNNLQINTKSKVVSSTSLHSKSKSENLKLQLYKTICVYRL